MDTMTDEEKVATMVALTTLFFTIGRYYLYHCNRRVPRSCGMNGPLYLQKTLNKSPVKFRKVYRMNQLVFHKLADILTSKGFLSATKTISVEEQLAYFLLTVGQQQSYSVTAEMFDRSNWTISKYFNKVLDAILKLHSDYVKRPSEHTHSKILTSSMFYPYFKDCIGVIDGTHIKANIPIEDQPRFWNRKGYLSQNVMAACSFDMQFTYVLAGWEGSATDSRVLKDALTRRDKIFVPEGKYYLVDASYANLPGFLAPYRGTRYHLQEFGDNIPRNEKELFNQRHSSLRNIIERTFGALKARFQMLKGAPPFSFKIQVKIVHACCILHNYIRGEDYDDIFEDKDDDLGGELSGGGDAVQLGTMDDTDSDDCDGLEDEGSQVISFRTQSALQSTRAAQFRDVISTSMWNDN